jgi:hypothetical protein
MGEGERSFLACGTTGAGFILIGGTVSAGFEG